MAAVADKLYGDETIRAVVDAYDSGEKISSIERRLSVDRSAITWILEQHGKMPKRYRRAERLAGNREQMAHLYAHIERQDAYIVELQALLKQNKIRFPPRPEISK